MHWPCANEVGVVAEDTHILARVGADATETIWAGFLHLASTFDRLVFANILPVKQESG